MMPAISRGPVVGSRYWDKITQNIILFPRAQVWWPPILFLCFSLGDGNPDWAQSWDGSHLTFRKSELKRHWQVVRKYKFLMFPDLEAPFKPALSTKMFDHTRLFCVPFSRPNLWLKKFKTIQHITSMYGTHLDEYTQSFTVCVHPP